MWEDCGVVSDCEELVRVTLKGWWGWDANQCFQKQEKHIRAWVGWVNQIDWDWRLLQRVTERTVCGVSDCEELVARPEW